MVSRRKGRTTATLRSQGEKKCAYELNRIVSPMKHKRGGLISMRRAGRRSEGLEPGKKRSKVGDEKTRITRVLRPERSMAGLQWTEREAGGPSVLRGRTEVMSVKPKGGK